MEKFGFEIFIEINQIRVFGKIFIKVGKIDILIDDGGHTNEQQQHLLSMRILMKMEQ